MTFDRTQRLQNWHLTTALATFPAKGVANWKDLCTKETTHPNDNLQGDDCCRIPQNAICFWVYWL